jgi:hypothetical protein
MNNGSGALRAVLLTAFGGSQRPGAPLISQD